MNAILMPHDLYTYIEDDFKIIDIYLYDNSVLCFVFWKNKQIAFKNGFIKNATFIDEEIIELEIIHPSGKIVYYYNDPRLRESILIKNKHSKILDIRRKNGLVIQENEQDIYPQKN